MMPTDQLKTAIFYHQQGDFQKAETIYQQILQANPNHVEALHLIGVLAYQMEHFESAISFISKAIQLHPGIAPFHSNLGNALKSAGRMEEALEQYQEAIRLEPNYVDAYYNLGTLFKFWGDLDAAVSFYHKVVQLSPQEATPWNELGNLLHTKGQLDEAIACYQKALQLNPNSPEAYNNLGTAFQAKGQRNLAIRYYQQGLTLCPDDARIHHNLANVLGRIGQLNQARYHYKKAIQIRPDLGEAYNGLGLIARDLAQLDEAILYFQRALQLIPSYADAHANLICCMHGHQKYTPAHILEESKRWTQCHAKHLYPFRLNFRNKCDPDKRLRIGYMSAHFCHSAIVFFTQSLFAHHDKKVVEIIAYADLSQPDSTTTYLKTLFDKWRPIYGMTDTQVSELVQADGIDILVDLNGYMEGNRLLVFARKPAPVQMTLFPGTTGLKTMDYRITDKWIDPIDEPNLSTEELIRLPHCLLCYTPFSDSPPIQQPPSVMEAGIITFGSFNNLHKLNHFVVALWSELLLRLPQAQLVLKTAQFSDPETCERYFDLFEQLGVQRSRICLMSAVPLFQNHLEMYHRIDIALDPFPYTGMTTTCEALWMGVPVIVLKGQTHFGRGSTSILANLGLQDLIAHSQEDYIEKACRLSQDIERLKDLKVRLRQHMTSSILCDGKRYAQAWEAVYRQVWRKYCDTKMDN